MLGRRTARAAGVAGLTALLTTLIACTSSGEGRQTTSAAATTVSRVPVTAVTTSAPHRVSRSSARSSLPSAPRSTHVTHPAAPARSRPSQPTTRAPAPPVASALPLQLPTGDATQVITVTAPTTSSTIATVQAWQRTSNGWTRSGPRIGGHLGSAGLTSHPSEALSATPIGSFTLTQAFGSLPNPGTAEPYFQTGADDWWVSDPNSPMYNTHQRCSVCGFNTSVSENLLAAGYVYSYAVVIDYNRFPAVAGAGSAFFLHVTDGGPTAGCVSIPQANLVSIMRWLSPAAHPHILIGVG
jgi:L,D-peptidoglycan transpeptidase YkuD (ErfK/YbiS/YcfS/YnhG family)